MEVDIAKRRRDGIAVTFALVQHAPDWLHTQPSLVACLQHAWNHEFVRRRTCAGGRG
jgi:hypothetical protein